MPKEHRPNLRCEHCGYEWYSFAHAKNRYYVPFCLKCYKASVVPIEAGVVGYTSQKIRAYSKKKATSFKKYCASHNYTIEGIREQYSLESRIVSDVLLFALGVGIIVALGYYFLVVWVQ